MLFGTVNTLTTAWREYIMVMSALAFVLVTRNYFRFRTGWTYQERWMSRGIAVLCLTGVIGPGARVLLAYSIFPTKAYQIGVYSGLALLNVGIVLIIAASIKSPIRQSWMTEATKDSSAPPQG